MRSTNLVINRALKTFNLTLKQRLVAPLISLIKFVVGNFHPQLVEIVTTGHAAFHHSFRTFVQMKMSMGPEIDPHGSYVTGLLQEFYYYYRVNPRRGQKKIKKVYLNGALLLGQNQVLVLLINFFPFPFLYQNDDKIS